MQQDRGQMDRSSNRELARLFKKVTYEGYMWPKALFKGVKHTPKYDEKTCYKVEQTSTNKKKHYMLFEEAVKVFVKGVKLCQTYLLGFIHDL